MKLSTLGGVSTSWAVCPKLETPKSKENATTHGSPTERHKGDLIDLAEGEMLGMRPTPEKLTPLAHKKILSDSVIAKRYKARFNKICK